jgi:hypothetical protein
MNKLERHRLKMVRFKRRLKNLGIKTIEKYHLYRTTGKPCSCSMCSPLKYSRKIKHKNKYFESLPE